MTWLSELSFATIINHPRLNGSHRVPKLSARHSGSRHPSREFSGVLGRNYSDMEVCPMAYFQRLLHSVSRNMAPHSRIFTHSTAQEPKSANSTDIRTILLEP